MEKDRLPRVTFSRIKQVTDYLENSLNYEKITGIGYDRRNFNLSRMELLLERLGQPQKNFKSIHIAGTKGKGSSASIIELLLRSGGICTGLHTSPHLSSICERMKVNGQSAPENRFCELVEEHMPVIDNLRSGTSRLTVPTYFELLVALSFDFFARSGAEWAVVETGLGGRLDATNILTPEICLITPIGFDHMDKLGDTAGKIAAEKAGILKNGIPLVLSRQDYLEASEVILERAEKLGCQVWQVGKDIVVENVQPVKAAAVCGHIGRPGWTFDVRGPDWHYVQLYTPLLGGHQVFNTAAALGVIHMLKEKRKLDISGDTIREAIASSACPARVEIVSISPLFILDTAHTVESVAALAQALRVHFPDHNIHLVFGCSSDKNHEKMLEILSAVSRSVTLVRSASSRSESTEKLAESARKANFSDIRESADTAGAVKQLLQNAGEKDLLCVTGSFFLAGEIAQAG